MKIELISDNADDDFMTVSHDGKTYRIYYPAADGEQWLADEPLLEILDAADINLERVVAALQKDYVFYAETARKLSAFEALERDFGQSSALSILNELIGERMMAEHPDYDELDEMAKDMLWNKYAERYSGDNAEELLAPYIEENLGEED